MQIAMVSQITQHFRKLFTQTGEEVPALEPTQEEPAWCQCDHTHWEEVGSQDLGLGVLGADEKQAIEYKYSNFFILDFDHD